MFLWTLLYELFFEEKKSSCCFSGQSNWKTVLGFCDPPRGPVGLLHMVHGHGLHHGDRGRGGEHHAGGGQDVDQ